MKTRWPEIPLECRYEGRDEEGLVVADISRALRNLYDALGGAEGIARLEQAADEAQAERTRWEAEHPGLRYSQQCHCFCQVRHPGVSACAGDVEGFEVRLLHGQPVQVPMCQACADAALW